MSCEGGHAPEIIAAPLSAEFLAAILENVAHPIFVKDRQLRLVLFNRSLCELVGRRPEEVRGRTDHDLFAREEADSFRRVDLEVIASGQPRTMEGERITDTAGRQHLLSTIKVPLCAADGQVTHLVGIIHDITQLERAQRALREANEKLERRVAERTAALQEAQAELVRKERLAVLGQLAGGLAHQIRNPLGTIANAAYLLKRAAEVRSGSDLDRPIAILLEEVWRANRIIDALLDYGRARPANCRRTSVPNLVMQTLAYLNVPPSIALEQRLSETPSVLVDRQQVSEALGNLLQNALEAMPAGGKLTVGARRDGPSVVLSVADTGPGIPADLQDRVFQPLWTTKPLGLGLGLTTARRLVENQRGAVRFHSVPGQGTVFEVELPIAPE